MASNVTVKCKTNYACSFKNRLSKENVDFSSFMPTTQ